LGPAKGAMSLQASETVLTTIHGPRWRLLLIGAGQLSAFLARIAVGMDYHVTVCDPREEYRESWNVPDVDVVHAMPDDLVLDIRPDARSAVVALTHDPKLDDLALMEALKSEAFYVGAIGSRANNAKRRERLKLFGVTDAQLAKLCGPVGIYIGSKTPAEIAISILAEMTAAKNGVPLPVEMQIEHAKRGARAEPSGSACGLR
jgi:xanthine dehydrogenase accessory factor